MLPVMPVRHGTAPARGAEPARAEPEEGVGAGLPPRTVARGAWAWAAAAALLAALAVGVRAGATKEWADEGYFANGALRVLAGEVIYRDFQHNYPPGRAYTLALLVHLFGQELGVVRALWIACQAAAAALAVRFAARAGSATCAGLAGIAVAGSGAFLNKAPELFLAALILVVLARVVEGRTADWAAGAWLALAAHYRHDVAVFGALLFPVALALSALLDPRRGEPPARAVLRRLRAAWPFLLGAAAAAAPLTLYLAWHGALGDALRDLTVSGFLANQSLSKPFPAPVREWTAAGLLEALRSERPLFWIPPLTYLAALALAAARLRARGIRGIHANGAPDERWRGALLLVAALLGILLFLQVLPRSDLGHLEKAYVPAHVLGVLVPLELARVARRRRGAGRWAAASGALLLALLPLWHLVVVGVLHNRSAPYLLANRELYETIATPHGELVFRREKAPGIRRVFARLAPHAGAEGEWLVAFPAGALVNFLFDLPSPLPYDLLRPGELAGDDVGDLVPNHPEVLRGIEERLRATRPRFLLQTGEETNDELTLLVHRFAREGGYRRTIGAYFTLFERP